MLKVEVWIVAQRLVTQLVDDLDGAELTKRSGQTVSFGLDGRTYEIDLSNRNAKRLRDELQPYIDSGRKLSRRRGAGSGGTQRDAAQTRHIREWAQSNGHDVSKRGRIPASVVAAYEAAR